MNGVSRFDCPSSPLALSQLLAKARQALCIALAAAAVGHLGLTRIRALEGEQKAAKPLTTHFIKRQPRLTKPLELKKRPQPKRRHIQRKIVAVKARIQPDRGVPFQPKQVLSGLATPSATVRRTASFGSVGSESRSLAAAIEGAKEAPDKIELSLELLDIQALDVGKYHALVVQDPQDKRGVRGFCHLAVVPPVVPERPGEWGDPAFSFESYIAPAFPKLVLAMNEYTDVNTDLLGRITVDNPEILKAPWVFFGQRRHFVLGDALLRCLGEYMLSGGFVFADGGDIPMWEAGLTATRECLLGALKAHGVQAALEKLPNSSPVYHCYFDFDGPPTGGDSAGHSQQPSLWKVKGYLEAIHAGGRLFALYSQKHYGFAWAHFGWGSYQKWDPVRPLQFGVNTIVFALTQEGSVTHRLMESVAY